MKLYVDDVRNAPEGWELCRTITRAIELLATQKVTEVSLDFDAGYHRENGDGSFSFVDSENFSPIAWFISYMPREIRPKVHVHSWNSMSRGILGAILGVDFENVGKR